MKIRFSYINLVTIPFFYVLGFFPEYIAVSCFMFLHEAVHILTALILGGKVYELNILPVGFNAGITENCLDRVKKLILYFSGATTNFIIALILHLTRRHIPLTEELTGLYVSQNLMLAVFNLLPILPLDGGKIIKVILDDRIGFFSAGRVIRTINIAVAVIVAVSGLILSFEYNNISLLLISVFLFFDFYDSKTEDSLMIMKNIFFRRERFKRKGIYAARELAVLKTTPIGEVLQKLDFDRYHIIFVLGDKLEPVRILGEQEVLDGIVSFGINTTFGELIDKI